MTRDEERARELIAQMSGSPVSERVAMLAAALREAEERGENAAVAPLLSARVAAAVAAARKAALRDASDHARTFSGSPYDDPETVADSIARMADEAPR